MKVGKYGTCTTCYSVLLFNSYFSFFISFTSPVPSRVHGISSPSWSRWLEDCVRPVTVECIEPPIRKNSEQTFERFLGKCPMMVASFVTATAYVPIGRIGWLPVTHQYFPTTATQTSFVHVVASDTAKYLNFTSHLKLAHNLHVL